MNERRRRASLDLGDHYFKFGEQLVNGGLIPGYQVAVSNSGDVWQKAGGSLHDGSPMTHEAVHQLHCLLKPAIALAVIVCIDDGMLDRSTTLAELGITVGLELGEVTVGELLNHGHPYRTPSLLQWRLADQDTRREFASLVRLGHLVRSDSQGYSEFVGWYLLECVLRSVADGDAWEVLGAHRLWNSSSGAHELKRESKSQMTRRGVCVWGLPHRWIPALSELDRPNGEMLASGCEGSAADALRLYAVICDRLSGRNQERPGSVTLRTIGSTARVTEYDPVLRRPVSFVDGMMKDPVGQIRMGLHHVRSFGHTGSGSTCFALILPDAEVVIAVVINNLITDQRAYRELVGEFASAVLDEVVDLPIGGG